MGYYNEAKKEFIGTYKGFRVMSYGTYIAGNWYSSKYWVQRNVNGRNMKMKGSECVSVKSIKEFINNYISEKETQS